MSMKNISEEISKVIDKDLSNELLKEYDLARRFHFLEDWEKSILHASKFSELTLAVIENMVDEKHIDINNIHFEKLFNELIKKTKVTGKDEILMLAIPRVAKSIYTIRNKRRVAHIKAVDPNFLDSQYCISACDWILSQFVMLFLESSPTEVDSIVHSLIEKQVPFVEQFEDNSLVILKEGLNFREQFLVALYRLGKRISKKEITRILKTYSQLVNSTSKNLEKDKLVHVNDNGVVLTKKGLKFVEKKLLSH